MDSRLKVGSVLRDKWHLDALLGAGGMSSVYAATHRNGMRGAIKILHPELAGDEEIGSRFRREGYAANRVQHPGVVRVIDDDQTEDGLVFLVMDLLIGRTLKQKWVESDRRMDVAPTMSIVESLLDVLEAAHACGVVHRDIKPDNVFLTDSGAVMLLDFGIARVREVGGPTAGATSVHAMMGTPAFMPPEQALAQWDKVDHRCDLFSVAATAFTVMSGTLVHAGASIPELLVSAAMNAVPPVRTALPELDEHLASVLDRALKFDVAERWPDAHTMRMAVANARIRSSGSRSTLRMSHKPALPIVETSDEHPTIERQAPSSLAPLQATPPSLRWPVSSTRVDVDVPARASGRSASSGGKLVWAGAALCVGIALVAWAVLSSRPKQVLSSGPPFAPTESVGLEPLPIAVHPTMVVSPAPSESTTTLPSAIELSARASASAPPRTVCVHRDPFTRRCTEWR